MAFTCTHFERRYLETCARKAGQTRSLYLRGLVLQGYKKQPKVVPEDVRTVMGQLMEVAGQLHPFSCKRLDGEDFNALERAEARLVIRQIESLIKQVKSLVP